jgi:hypothetical protein
MPIVLESAAFFCDRAVLGVIAMNALEYECFGSVIHLGDQVNRAFAVNLKVATETSV